MVMLQLNYYGAIKIWIRVSKTAHNVGDVEVNTYFLRLLINNHIIASTDPTLAHLASSTGSSNSRAFSECGRFPVSIAPKRTECG